MNTRQIQHTTPKGIVIDIKREDLNVLQDEGFCVRVVQETYDPPGGYKRTGLPSIPGL